MRISALPSFPVRAGGIEFPSPLIVASGVWSADRPLPEGCGGVVGKGITLHPREGNGGPRLFETPAGLLNSIGLQNPGVEGWIRGALPALERNSLPVLANVAFDDLAELEAILVRLAAEGDRIAGVELNVSCPNVASGGAAWGCCPERTGEAVRLARGLWRKALWVKMTPEAPDFVTVARSAQAAGADALVVANCRRGAAIDLASGRPFFRRGTAGLSGPAILPLTLRLLLETRVAVSLPLVGCGGAWRAEDVLSLLYAGAEAVELGTALFRDEGTPAAILEGLGAYCGERGIRDLSEIVGRAAEGFAFGDGRREEERNGCGH